MLPTRPSDYLTGSATLLNPPKDVTAAVEITQNEGPADGRMPTPRGSPSFDGHQL